MLRLTVAMWITIDNSQRHSNSKNMYITALSSMWLLGAELCVYLPDRRDVYEI